MTGLLQWPVASQVPPKWLASIRMFFPLSREMEGGLPFPKPHQPAQDPFIGTVGQLAWSFPQVSRVACARVWMARDAVLVSRWLGYPRKIPKWLYWWSRRLASSIQFVQATSILQPYHLKAAWGLLTDLETNFMPTMPTMPTKNQHPARLWNAGPISVAASSRDSRRVEGHDTKSLEFCWNRPSNFLWPWQWSSGSTSLLSLKPDAFLLAVSVKALRSHWLLRSGWLGNIMMCFALLNIECSIQNGVASELPMLFLYTRIVAAVIPGIKSCASTSVTLSLVYETFLYTSKFNILVPG